MPDSNTNANGTQEFNPEEEGIEDMVAKAVEAAAKGENAEQLLEVMLVSLPVSLREKMRKQFLAALAKRGLRQPSGDADIPSRATLSRIRAALAVSARQMMDRIAQLVRSRPDLATRIKQAGMVLAQNGVRNDKVQLTDADLGTISPSTATGKGQQERSGRG